MQSLDEKDFIRQKIFSGKSSQFKKYSELMIGSRSLSALIFFEIITGILGFLPGAVGLILRKVLYPFLFKRVGKGVIFGKNLTIRHPDKITLGDNVVIDDFALLDGRGSGNDGVFIGENTIIGRNSIIQSKIGPIKVGNNCNIGTNTVLVAQGGITIGDWAQIAGGCKISGGLFKSKKNIVTAEFPFIRFSKGPISIGEKSFLGGSVQVIDGVTIGKNCMIGTGSVIMNNIPDFSIYMPKPGMIIGKIELNEENY